MPVATVRVTLKLSIFHRFRGAHGAALPVRTTLLLPTTSQTRRRTFQDWPLGRSPEARIRKQQMLARLRNQLNASLFLVHGGSSRDCPWPHPHDSGQEKKFHREPSFTGATLGLSWDQTRPDNQRQGFLRRHRDHQGQESGTLMPWPQRFGGSSVRPATFGKDNALPLCCGQILL